MNLHQYRVGECRQSITGIGVVWPVLELHGRCGCGATEMTNEIAFFVNRADAESFVHVKPHWNVEPEPGLGPDGWPIK
jgi:hypothetical protein